MKAHEIEYKVLNIIDRVNSAQPIEDYLVELKSEWPSPEKAARQIAGHANAARGAPILWLIGVDQEHGVVGAEVNELANWYTAVKSLFDGLSPYLTYINIPYKQHTVVALHFDTSRAPYVVKNPGRTSGYPTSPPTDPDVSN